MRHAQRGQSLVEYVIIIGSIALIALATLALVGGGVAGVFKHTLASWSGPSKNIAHLEDSFDGHGNLQWECTNGWYWRWRKARRCQSYWGGWRIRHGRMESRSWFSRAVSAVTGPNYTYALDLRVKKSWWSRYFPSFTSRIVFRYQDSRNYYALIPRTDGTLVLAKRQNGRWYSNLAYVHAGIDPGQMHRYQVQVKGNEIQIAIDGQQLMTYRDPQPIPDGVIGVENYVSHSVIDNVTVDVEH